jgi:DNA polymerase III delta subunit
MKTFFWLFGDRYLCVHRKNELLYAFGVEHDFEIVEFTSTSASDFASVINQRDLFSGQKIFIHEGSLPEPEKLVDFIENIKDVLIVLEDCKYSRPDNRKAMVKRYKQSIEFFESVIGDNGFPDKKKIPEAVKRIQSIVPGKTSDDIVEYLLSVSDYDYGKTVNEIEKASVYVGDYIDKKTQILKVLSGSNAPNIEKLTSYIANKQVEKTFIIVQEIINHFDINELFMGIMGLLSESFQFCLYCRMAKDNDLVRNSDVGNFVAQNWRKKGKPVDAIASANRYEYYKPMVANSDVRHLNHIIGCIEKVNKEFIEKTYHGEYLIKRLLVEIFKI